MKKKNPKVSSKIGRARILFSFERCAIVSETKKEKRIGKIKMEKNSKTRSNNDYASCTRVFE